MALAAVVVANVALCLPVHQGIPACNDVAPGSLLLSQKTQLMLRLDMPDLLVKHQHPAQILVSPFQTQQMLKPCPT